MNGTLSTPPAALSPAVEDRKRSDRRSVQSTEEKVDNKPSLEHLLSTFIEIQQRQTQEFMNAQFKAMQEFQQKQAEDMRKFVQDMLKKN